MIDGLAILVGAGLVLVAVADLVNTLVCRLFTALTATIRRSG